MQLGISEVLHAHCKYKQVPYERPKMSQIAPILASLTIILIIHFLPECIIVSITVPWVFFLDHHQSQCQHIHLLFQKTLALTIYFSNVRRKSTYFLIQLKKWVGGRGQHYILKLKQIIFKSPGRSLEYLLCA